MSKLDRKNLENKFHDAMLEIYEKAKRECRYNATRFLQMVSEHGGLEAAKILIHASHLSDGFIELWKCHRLDITVEAEILKPEWQELFSEDERKIARKRLTDLDYEINQ